MQLALPQLDQKDTYHRLATLYTFVFAVMAVSFYLTLLTRGVDIDLALFASIAAGLHYSLLRLSGAIPTQAPDLAVRRYKPATLLADTDLVKRIDQLMRETRGSRDEIGLMLITLAGGFRGSEAPAPEVIKLVRGELFRAADSRIFQVDERTLAIVENQLDVVLHFDKIALDLHRQLIASRAAEPETAANATVGIAVATSGSECSATEFVEQARTAIRLAQANDRDTFFRRV